MFVASLGNIAPYQNSLHSAGHILNSSLRDLLSKQQDKQPRFAHSTRLANGFVSAGPNFTLWKSPSYMNLSGPPLARAWQSFLANLPSDLDRRLARLVVLHDELESELGRLKVKSGGTVRGHKGLKSVVDQLGAKEFVRVGVGIGRPDSRKPEDVSRYVLRKISHEEMQALNEAAGEVLLVLNTIREVDGCVPYTSPY